MTPEQLAVERDALLTGGRTLEEVEAMQFGPELLDALCLMVEHYARDLDVDDRAGFAFVDLLLRRAHSGRGVWASQQRGYVVQQSVEERHAALLSLPETSAGASAPRPSGETP